MSINSLLGDKYYKSFTDYTERIVEHLIPMAALENDNLIERAVGEESFDQVDSSSNNNGESGRVVSGSTQTDFDTVDCRGASGITAKESVRNGHTSNGHEGGLFSSLITLVLPAKRKNEEDCEEDVVSNKRCVSTQTEESPIAIQAHELCWMVIQELALETQVGTSSRNDVFEALCCCVCEILDKHEILFNGMLRRFEVSDSRVFTSIANELFEATTAAPRDLTITWGRVVSLFAFAVKLAQKYRETQEEDKIDNVVNYLSDYISKHLLDFVQAEGGWEGLVKQFPVPDSEDKQVKRAMMWSGLCVGLVATMYVSSFLSK